MDTREQVEQFAQQLHEAGSKVRYGANSSLKCNG